MSHSLLPNSSAPLPKGLTVDQMYEWNATFCPDVPTFRFPGESGETIDVTWSNLEYGITRGIEIIAARIPECRESSEEDEQPIVVGIFAAAGMSRIHLPNNAEFAEADILTYTTFLFSHIRLTHPDSGRALLPFPISTRNSPAAVAHLLHTTDVRYLWVTEGLMTTIAHDALRDTPEDVVLLPFPPFHALYTGVTFSPSSGPDLIKNDGKEWPVLSFNKPAIILHSSGSTAFPKPRTVTHLLLAEWADRFIRYEGFSLEGQIAAIHGIHVFHALGVIIASWAATSGVIRAVPSPRVSSSPMTPELHIQGIINTKSTVVICVPRFLEAWCTNPKNVEVLKKLHGIMWAGGPLSERVGRFLRDELVQIYAVYGATEFGLISSIPNNPYDEGYEWFRFLPSVSFELVPEPGEARVFELILKNVASHHITTINTEINGVPAYATNDLLELHPNDHTLFKIKGRKDDQIMLSTGEKTNPGPLEAIMVKNTHIKAAIMFGRGHPSNGVLIEPESYKMMEQISVATFRTLIWPSIEEANIFAPAHSRIFKEMILLASPSKPLSYTAKGTPRRGAILKEYATEIDAIYTAVDESAQSHIPIPTGTSPGGGWTEQESLRFVHEAVHSVITGVKDMKNEDDIFAFGCDSLQATYIRNTILYALRQADPNANIQQIPSNFVYQHPTVNALAIYVSEMSQAVKSTTNIDPESRRRQRLQDLIEKYTQDWPVHRPQTTADSSSNEVVLLTGSTGGLGSQILAQLVEIPSITRIYALNRPSQRSSYDRQHESFVDRGNDVSLLQSDKIVYVDGDTSVVGFNLNSDLFNKIRDSVTMIIHNAWRVDFNLSLESFQPAVRGVRYMIDLALRSPRPTPPRLLFTSSIGIIKSWCNIPPAIEGDITDLSIINTSGYSESKWVSERILFTARQHTSLRPVIVRVGQLCGGINGNWNTREWFPALARASQVVEGVPDNSGLVSFVPLHTAASVIIELRSASHDFAHIVHPRPVTWRSIIYHLAEALQVPVIPYNEWLLRLEASPKTGEALHSNPALHLLDFYKLSAPRNGFENVQQREAMGWTTYETTTTVMDAPSLRPNTLSQLGKEEVLLWVDYWKHKGALKF
ncbi:hypothetical protein BU17DRAFT_95460 [Hysterangium stoloniferum]|nr:hypothetical protein BU17DRAFT_95460 [Hysterangium stoloniferum]